MAGVKVYLLKNLESGTKSCKKDPQKCNQVCNTGGCKDSQRMTLKKHNKVLLHSQQHVKNAPTETSLAIYLNRAGPTSDSNSIHLIWIKQFHLVLDWKPNPTLLKQLTLQEVVHGRQFTKMPRVA